MIEKEKTGSHIEDESVFSFSGGWYDDHRGRK